MKQNHTDITIVLDRSGSMASVQDDTIGGFNTFLADQKKVAGTATITLNQFDDVFEHVISAEDIQKANPLNKNTYRPRGSTALLDAIGRSINETGKRLEKTPDHERPSKVICVIITDGHENASREFTNEKIAEMIRHQRDNYQWEFVFLGTNQDAIATASKMNIPAGTAMTYANNAAGNKAVYASLGANVTRCRMSASADMTFTRQQRKEQEDAV